MEYVKMSFSPSLKKTASQPSTGSILNTSIKICVDEYLSTLNLIKFIDSVQLIAAEIQELRTEVKNLNNRVDDLALRPDLACDELKSDVYNVATRLDEIEASMNLMGELIATVQTKIPTSLLTKKP